MIHLCIDCEAQQGFDFAQLLTHAKLERDGTLECKAGRGEPVGGRLGQFRFESREQRLHESYWRCPMIRGRQRVAVLDRREAEGKQE